MQRNLNTARNHTEVCRALMEAEIEKTREGRERKQLAAERIEDQLTRELELEDEMIQRKAAAQVPAERPEGEISEGEIKKMDDELFEDLENAPSRRSDARPMSPDKFDLGTPVGDMSMEMEDSLDLEDGPRSSTEVSARLAHRTPAQTRSDVTDGQLRSRH